MKGRIAKDPARLACSPELSSYFASNQRHIDQVLADEPDLHLVGANDRTGQQIVRAHISQIVGFFRQVAGVFQDQLVRFEQARDLHRHFFAVIGARSRRVFTAIRAPSRCLHRPVSGRALQSRRPAPTVRPHAYRKAGGAGKTWGHRPASATSCIGSRRRNRVGKKHIQPAHDLLTRVGFQADGQVLYDGAVLLDVFCILPPVRCDQVRNLFTGWRRLSGHCYSSLEPPLHSIRCAGGR